jgi:probable HAF family extracellular repeat protein
MPNLNRLPNCAVPLRKLNTLLALLVLCFGTKRVLAAKYAITDLGTLGGTQSHAVGINASGQVVGDSTIAGDTTIHAFRTSPNGVIDAASDLGALGSSSYATDINDSGQAVGTVRVDGTPHAFRTAPNGFISLATDLGPNGPETHAIAINASGQAAAYVQSASFRVSATGTIDFAHTLGSLSGITFASDLNDLGQVVGESVNSNGFYRAFRTAPNGTITTGSDLGTLGGSNSHAHGINSSGQTVGDSNPTGSTATHAFRTTSTGNITASSDLGTLGGANSFAYDINDVGQIVGDSNVAGNSGYHAFFLDTTGAMQDLNDLIPSNSGWVLQQARGINAIGQIVGNGTIGGHAHGYLLTPLPTPEPAASVAFLCAAVSLHSLSRRTVRSRQNSVPTLQV